MFAIYETFLPFKNVFSPPLLIFSLLLSFPPGAQAILWGHRAWPSSFRRYLWAFSSWTLQLPFLSSTLRSLLLLLDFQSSTPQPHPVSLALKGHVQHPLRQTVIRCPRCTGTVLLSLSLTLPVRRGESVMSTRLCRFPALSRSQQSYVRTHRKTWGLFAYEKDEWTSSVHVDLIAHNKLLVHLLLMRWKLFASGGSNIY